MWDETTATFSTSTGWSIVPGCGSAGKVLVVWLFSIQALSLCCFTRAQIKVHPGPPAFAACDWRHARYSLTCSRVGGLAALLGLLGRSIRYRNIILFLLNCGMFRRMATFSMLLGFRHGGRCEQGQTVLRSPRVEFYLLSPLGLKLLIILVVAHTSRTMSPHRHTPPIRLCAVDHSPGGVGGSGHMAWAAVPQTVSDSRPPRTHSSIIVDPECSVNQDSQLDMCNCYEPCAATVAGYHFSTFMAFAGSNVPRASDLVGDQLGAPRALK